MDASNTKTKVVRQQGVLRRIGPILVNLICITPKSSSWGVEDGKGFLLQKHLFLITQHMKQNAYVHTSKYHLSKSALTYARSNKTLLQNRRIHCSLRAAIVMLVYHRSVDIRAINRSVRLIRQLMA